MCANSEREERQQPAVVVVGDTICAAKGRKTEKGRDILTGSQGLQFSTSIQNTGSSKRHRQEGKEKETESHVKEGNQSL